MEWFFCFVFRKGYGMEDSLEESGGGGVSSMYMGGIVLYMHVLL